MLELSPAQSRECIRLLGELQDQLESAIESELVPGTGEPMRGRKRLVADLRRQWKEAELVVKGLEGQIKG